MCIVYMNIIGLGDTQSFPLSDLTFNRLLTRKPTLPELLNLKTSSGSTVNIVQQIGTHYHVMGPLLLRDDTGAVTSAIISQHQRDAALINQEIMTRWLQGQGKLPVSWSTLIDVLKGVELTELSHLIQESLTSSTAQIPGEMDMRYAIYSTIFYMYITLCCYPLEHILKSNFILQSQGLRPPLTCLL